MNVKVTETVEMLILSFKLNRIQNSITVIKTIFKNGENGVMLAAAVKLVAVETSIRKEIVLPGITVMEIEQDKFHATHNLVRVFL